MKKTIISEGFPTYLYAITGTGFELRRILKNLVSRELVFYPYCDLPDVGLYPDDGSPRIYCLVIDAEHPVNGLPMVHWLTAAEGLEFFQREWKN